MNKSTFVTQPYLPDIEDFIPYIHRIWDNKILTNGGELHNRLEESLERYLGVENIVLFNNGTSALITALQYFDFPDGGEVITTPYSFVATAHSIIWNKLKPIFVDIEEHSPNLDINKIKEAYTENTVAILPVHCYGVPCKVDEIDFFAKQKNIKVIYDAAHAFGVQTNGKSVLNYGDLSILSFHATKVFNTFEGGAIVCKDKKTKDKLIQLKNFGIVDESNVDYFGSNGKMSEIHAAFGLLQLETIDHVLDLRGNLDSLYRKAIQEIEGLEAIERGNISHDNYAYFPIVVTENYPLTRDQLFNKLKENNIFSRKYFWPLITDFKVFQQYKAYTPNAEKMSNSVICLPLYPLLKAEDLNRIVEILRDF